MKIKAPDITATGVLALAALAVGGFVIWRGSKAIGDAVNWAGKKVEAAKEAVVNTAITATAPLSPTGILPPIGTQVKPYITQEDRDWQNLQLQALAMGGMGA